VVLIHVYKPRFIFTRALHSLDSGMDEKELFKLEKAIIKRYKCFRELKPLPVEILDADADFSMRFNENRRSIQVNREFLARASLKEVKDAVKHELIHVVYPKFGHSIEFYKLAKKLKIADEYTLRKLLFSEVNKSTLEGRIQRVIEDGEEVYHLKRKPSFRGLKEFCEDQYFPIGKALRQLRMIYGLSREEVAEKAGVKPSVLKRIEENEKQVLTENERLMKRIFHAITMCARRKM